MSVTKNPLASILDTNRITSPNDNDWLKDLVHNLDDDIPAIRAGEALEEV